MKRLLVTLLAVGGLVGAAHAAQTYVSSSEIQSTTRATPETDAPGATEKISLQGVKKIRATVCTCATTACTARDLYPITGGQMDVWYQHPDSGWSENPFIRVPLLPVDGGCETLPDIESPGGNVGGAYRVGYMMMRAVGVTKLYTDAGANVMVELEGISGE